MELQRSTQAIEKTCHLLIYTSFGERDSETRLVRAMKVRAVPTPLSPLLANLALHGIENIGKCIRYADDIVFIIQKDEDPEEMRKQIDQELQKRRLKVKESKTRLTDMTDGFDFLGFHFKRIGKPAIKSKRFPVKDWL